MSYLFPEIRTWFVHFIDHTSVVISLLYKYTDRDLPDGTEEFEESGSFFEACRSDFTRIIKNNYKSWIFYTWASIDKVILSFDYKQKSLFIYKIKNDNI